MFFKILEHVIKGFMADISKKLHFLAKNGQKKPFFWPKRVFLGPEWSQVGPHTLF